jgi:hypothetical protein
MFSEPWPHLRHRCCYINLPQHSAHHQPIPHPVQRLPPILIAASGRCDLFRVRSPRNWAGQDLHAAPAPAVAARARRPPPPWWIARHVGWFWFPLARSAAPPLATSRASFLLVPVRRRRSPCACSPRLATATAGYRARQAVQRKHP